MASVIVSIALALVAAFCVTTLTILFFMVVVFSGLWCVAYVERFMLRRFLKGSLYADGLPGNSA